MDEKELIEKNLPLVRYLALKKLGKNVSLDDLIQEGNMELINALKSYDASKGCKFSTYAYSRVKNIITMAIYKQATTIRFSVKCWENYIKLMELKNKLAIEFGREPRVEEIAQRINKPVSKVMNLFKIYDLLSVLSLDSFNSYYYINSKHFENLRTDYLYENENIEEDFSLESFVPAKEKSVDDIVCDNLEKEYLKKQVEKLLESSNLTERELEVLMLHHGFNGEPKSLAQISEIYNVSRQAINQTKLNALRKIKQCEYLQEIDYCKSTNNSSNDSSKFKFKKIYILKKEKLAEKNDEKNIYELFFNYSKEEIDEVLSSLNEEDSYLLLLRYGGNLENPMMSFDWTTEQMGLFSNYLVPKIEKQLVINKIKK